jgi:hypothetical protein
MNDELMAEAIGELKEANKNIATSMKGIEDNLKVLNDRNILHTEKDDQQHTSILQTLQTMTAKYWWLILALIGTLLIVLGYKEAAGHFITG